MTLSWPSRRRWGVGTGAPAFSGSSQGRIWPRLLPAASLRVGPRKHTEVTQSASQVSVQASAALSKEAEADSPEKTLALPGVPVILTDVVAPLLHRLAATAPHPPFPPTR